MENKPGDKALEDHRADDQALLKRAAKAEETAKDLVKGDQEIADGLREALQSVASTATNALTD